ncbi:hypothetical protein RKD55_001430 [Rossellomorea marisflavi]
MSGQRGVFQESLRTGHSANRPPKWDEKGNEQDVVRHPLQIVKDHVEQEHCMI